MKQMIERMEEKIDSRIYDIIKYYADHNKNIKDLSNIFQGAINNYFSNKEETLLIPISIYRYKEITPMGATVKFLRENKNLKFKKIGDLLGRNGISLSICYNKARKKISQRFKTGEDSFLIPITIFSSKFTIFESIAVFLKENLGYNFHKIALAMNRDDRTIWTIYNHAKQKIKK